MTRWSFDDGKDADALRTIGELGRALGLKPHVLRYWEEQFPMLKPLKRSGGRRYYRAEDVALVQTIDRLVNEEGYTLKGARAAIEKGRAGMSEPDDDGQSEAPREGMRRYLTAKDLPDRDDPRDRAAHQLSAEGGAARADGSFGTSTSLRGESDLRMDVVRKLKDIRAALAEAVGD